MQGVAHNHPEYPGPASDDHDISVVELSAAQIKVRWAFTPAALPKAGALDALGPQGLRAAPFSVTGYGTQEAVRGPGGHTHPGCGVRMKAPVTFDALNDAWTGRGQRAASSGRRERSADGSRSSIPSRVWRASGSRGVSAASRR